MRVLSLLPSATEIVSALGHGDELVGRSAECDFPPTVRRLPVVMRPRTLDSDSSSRQIDDRVRHARARNESLYELDLELLRSLQPDLLITQDLCGVCSVTEEEVADACARVGVRPQVVSLSPTDLGTVWETIEELGRALDDPEAGATLSQSCRRRSQPSLPISASVAVVEWLDPPILAGLWTPDMIGAAGGRPFGPAASQPGLRTEWDSLTREPPDLLIVSPCSFAVERTVRELEDNARLGRAVRSVRSRLGTFIADEAYFSRPGPRLADGVDLVRGLLRGGSPSGPMPVVPLASVPAPPPEVRR